MRTKKKTIRVGIVYNAFDPTNVVKEEIVYKKGATLDHYLKGLPEECDWKIGLNGVPIEKDFNEIVPANDDIISLVVVPREGGAKGILRMVAMVALMVAAVYFLGPTSAFFAANALLATTAMVTAIVVGSVLINTLLPPAGLKAQKDDGQSYGYDGAKNTAKEGVPIPVVYGEYHVAGNYIDLFTENRGDNQFMHGRAILSDGEIDGVVGEPVLNDQPIRNFTNINYGHTKGLLDENINPLFGRAVSQQQRQVKLTTDWSEFTTTTDVDQLQINFGFPEGLCHVQKDGDKKRMTVSVEVQYRKGDGSWGGLGSSGFKSFSGVSAENTTFQVLVKGTPMTTSKLSENVIYNVEYRKLGDVDWTIYKTYNENVSSIERISNYNLSDSFIQGSMKNYLINKLPQEHILNIDLPLGQYEFRVTGQGQLLDSAYKSDEAVGELSSTTLTYTDSRTKALRKTYETPTLPRGTYQVRVRRTNIQATSDRDFDEVWLTDVGEIQHSKVAARSVATGWFTAKMTDQLSGIPNIVWPVKGVKVNKYDATGSIIATEWSANPAWIVLDMLISERRGAFPNSIKIDFPAFVDWAEYCETNSFNFNGVFDSTQSLWDAMANVFRVGRAAPTRIGTRLSVAIDRPTQPVMLFGPGNIEKGTFNISYMSLADRANEFEVSYFDKDDLNKQKTIRIVDPQAEIDGQIPKPAAYTLIGVDNFEQAQKEVWYQLYMNRLAKRVVTFDAPTESIGLGIGDVALIQHDMVNWGTSGRINAGSSTTVVKLDKEVIIETGESYKLLLTFDTIQKVTGTISNITDKIYLLENMVGDWSDSFKLKRIVTDTGSEAAIDRFEFQSGTSATVILDKNVTGTTFTIYDVDVVEERDVITAPSTTDTVTVSTPFPEAPSQFANYMFGLVDVVKKPFRLRAIAGDDIHSRKLTFVEYNEYIYSPPEFDIPQPTIRAPKLVNHITNLNYVSDIKLFGGNRKVRGILSWNIGNNNHYGGADIYVGINSEDLAYHSSVFNTTEAQFEFDVGVTVKFKVVAFDNTLKRANSTTAPIISQLIFANAEELVEPTVLSWNLTKIDFEASGVLSWTKAVEDTVNGVSAGNHTRVQIMHSDSTEWTDLGVTTESSMVLNGLHGGVSTVRTRTEKLNSISTWVELNINIPTPVLTAPTVDLTGLTIDHSLNTDGSADISFEWIWAGNENDIDGFEIIHVTETLSTPYTLGDSPASEIVTIVSPSDRYMILKGIPADKYYTFYVRAFKKVHNSFSPNGVIRSSAVKSTFSGEDPYRPSANVAFSGDVTGTIGGVPVEDVLAGMDGGDTDPPAQVSNLALNSVLATNADGTQIVKLTATWSASPESDLNHYILAIKEGTGNFIEFQTGPTAIEYVWNVLTNTQYTVNIRAVDHSGNRSVATADVVHTTLKDSVPPAVPAGLTATAAFNTIFLKWTNPADTDLSYIEIYENTVDNSGTATKIANVLSTPNGEGSFTRSGLATGSLRYYWLKAGDTSDNLSAFTASVNATTASVGMTDFGTGIRPPEVLGALPAAGTQGRMVFLTTDNKLYRDTGSAWTAAVPSTDISGQLTTGQLSNNIIDATKLANNAVTEGKLLDGAVTVNKIAAGSVTANKLVLLPTTGSLLNADPEMKDATAWVPPTGNAAITTNANTTDFVGGRAWTASVSSMVATESISIDPTKNYKMSIDARRLTGGDKLVYLLAWFIDGNGSTISGTSSPSGWPSAGSYHYFGLINQIPPFDRTTYTILFGPNQTAKIPADARYVRIGALLGRDGTNGFSYAGSFKLQEMTNAELIVDGAITAAKIAASTITGDKIAAGTLTAAHIATSTITAEKLAVGVLGRNLVTNGSGETGTVTGSWMTSEQIGATNTLTIVNGLFSGSKGENYLLITKAATTDGVGYANKAIPVTPGKTYALKVSLAGDTSTATGLYLRINWKTAKPTNPCIISADRNGIADYVANAPIPTAITTYEWTWTAPANAYWASPVIFNYINGPLTMKFAGLEMVEQASSTQIQDGAITTNHITVNTLNGDRIQADTLDATKIKANTILSNTIKVSGSNKPLSTAHSEAVWTSVSGTGKPADNAGALNILTTVDPALAQFVTITGNSIVQSQSEGNYSYAVKGEPMNGPCFAEVDIQPNTKWTMVALDDAATGTNFADMLVGAHYNYGSGGVAVYNHGTKFTDINIGQVTGKMHLVYEGGKVRLFIGGVERGNGYTPPAPLTTLHPKWHPYNINTVMTGLKAGQLTATTGAPAGTNVGGTAATTIETRANDPAARINAFTTTIDPGKILISGSTTLANWRNGSDTTKIEGGSIAANTITANKLSIGLRGVTITGLEFQANVGPIGVNAVNNVAFTAGTISYHGDDGILVSKSIASSYGTWTSGTLYLYWVKGSTVIQATTSLAAAKGVDNIILATYGGGTDLVANYGGTRIDGSKITTGTVTANQIAALTITGAKIAAGTLTADKMNVTSLSAITATIGTLRTATTGARTEIKDNQILVYDSSNVLRVRMGIW